MHPASLTVFFLREVAGGALLGLVLGYVGYRALKAIDDHPLELLITLALATGVYAAAFRLHVSGPIAVVIAGLFIGNPGRRFAMSETTIEHVDAFWQLVDYILNAVLFLLIALQVFGVPQGVAAAQGRADRDSRRTRRPPDLGRGAGHGDAPARDLHARSRADPHVERTARGNIGGAGAVAAAGAGKGHTCWPPPTRWSCSRSSCRD